MTTRTDLKDALNSTYKTVATVKNAHDAQSAAVQGYNWWLDRWAGTSLPWHVISVDLTLDSHLISSLGPNHLTQKHLGNLKSWTLEGFNSERVLAIYQSDNYTEQWVHSWIEAKTATKDSRVLNIDRKDKGPAIDLIGSGKLMKLK